MGVTQDPFAHTCIHAQEAARESQDLAAAAGWTCVSMPSSWRGVRGRGNIKKTADGAVPLGASSPGTALSYPLLTAVAAIFTPIR